jgi:hypothetical protein
MKRMDICDHHHVWNMANSCVSRAYDWEKVFYLLAKVGNVESWKEVLVLTMLRIDMTYEPKEQQSHGNGHGQWWVASWSGHEWRAMLGSYLTLCPKAHYPLSIHLPISTECVISNYPTYILTIYILFVLPNILYSFL